jgi:hypothetical protein
LFTGIPPGGIEPAMSAGRAQRKSPAEAGLFRPSEPAFGG